MIFSFPCLSLKSPIVRAPPDPSTPWALPVLFVDAVFDVGPVPPLFAAPIFFPCFCTYFSATHGVKPYSSLERFFFRPPSRTPPLNCLLRQKLRPRFRARKKFSQPQAGHFLDVDRGTLSDSAVLQGARPFAKSLLPGAGISTLPNEPALQPIMSESNRSTSVYDGVLTRQSIRLFTLPKRTFSAAFGPVTIRVFPLIRKLSFSLRC